MDYLNHKLESILENTPYDNVYRHRNPYSKSTVVLNWPSVPSEFENPAIYITNKNKYSYDKISEVIEELRGSVIVWMENKESNVDIFYLDVDGNKFSSRLSAGAD